MATAAAVAQPGESDTMQDRGGIRILTLRERFALAYKCWSHNWSFPQTLSEMKAAYKVHRPYNSHQQCPKCGGMRLFNSNTMEAGPAFQRLLKQNG